MRKLSLLVLLAPLLLGTVPTAVSYNEYTGNGVTTAFPTTFGFQASSHLVVKLILISSGAETIQTLNVHYTVTGAGAATGTVTMLSAPSSSYKLRIERTVPITQTVDFRTAGPFSAETHTLRHDYRTHVEQQLDRRISTLEASGSSTTVVLAGNGLTKSGDTVHVGAGNGIQSNADDVEVLYGSAGSMAQVSRSSASAGVANTAARIDHKHDVATATPGYIQVGDTRAEGSSTALARADHTHQVDPPTAPVDVTKSAASAGVSALLCRADHKHDVSTAAAIELTDSTNAEGAATSLARSNHTHAHGNRGGGSLHAVATTSAAGFMSATDKTKLDALATETVSTGVARTTDATATTILTITPTDEQSEFIEVSIVGMQLLGATGGGYKIMGTFRRNDGSTFQVGSTTVVATHEDTAGWDVAFSVSSPNVLVRVTGAAATTVDWRAVARRVAAP